MDELARGGDLGIDLPDVRALPWVKIQTPEGLDKVPTTTDLGAGEKEVLALGMQVPGAVVVIDERLGRSYAEALQLTFTGTLGILLRAKREGRISPDRARARANIQTCRPSLSPPETAVYQAASNKP